MNKYFNALNWIYNAKKDLFWFFCLVHRDANENGNPVTNKYSTVVMCLCKSAFQDIIIEDIGICYNVVKMLLSRVH